MSAPDVETRLLEPGADVTDLAAGLVRARAEAGLEGPGRSAEEWAWWASAPGGLAVASVRDASGEVLAAVVAARRPARLEGEECTFLEAFEVYGRPAPGLARARSLRAAGEAFAQEFGGRFPEGHPVAFGVPTRRAHRFGLRRFAWEILRSENELYLEPGRFPAPPAHGVEVEEASSLPAEADDLAARFAAGRAALLWPGAEALAWRTLARPGRTPRLALARKGGELVGLAVLERGRLVQWVVPPEEREAAVALVAWGLERATAEGAADLAIRVPDTAPEWLGLQLVGFRARPTDDYVVFRSWHKPYVMSWLFQNAWYGAGDVEATWGGEASA